MDKADCPECAKKDDIIRVQRELLDKHEGSRQYLVDRFVTLLQELNDLKNDRSKTS